MIIQRYLISQGFVVVVVVAAAVVVNFDQTKQVSVLG